MSRTLAVLPRRNNKSEDAKPRDPHYLALRNFAMSLGIFNILGYTWLGFEGAQSWPFIAIGVAIVVEFTLESISAWADGRRPRFLATGRPLALFMLPIFITAVACNMLIYVGDRVWMMIFAVTVAIGMKYVLRAPIRGKMRHFMNPSNLGIIAVLTLFPSSVGVAPAYQFTENISGPLDIGFFFGLLMAGTMLNFKLTKKLPLIGGFLLFFVLQAVVRGLFLGTAILGGIAVVTSLAFVLYMNYMIPDPGTTPTKPRAQFIFGAGIGIMYGVVTGMQIVYGMFYALAIVCLLRGAGWWVATAVQSWRRRQAETEPAVVAEPAVVQA